MTKTSTFTKLSIAFAAATACFFVGGCAGDTDDEKTEESTGKTEERYVGCGGDCWWAGNGTRRQSSCGNWYTCWNHAWYPDNGRCNGGGCVSGGGEG